MIVHPSIAALRGDREPQRRAQEAISKAQLDWQKEPGAAELLFEFQDYGAGANVKQGGLIHSMFTQQGEGERLLLALSRVMCACFAQNPISQPPFRNSSSGRVSSMLLAKSGRAHLLLMAHEPGSYTLGSHAFSDSHRYDAVLGGTAEGRLVRKEGEQGQTAKFSYEKMKLQPGARLSLDLSCEGFEVETVSQRLVILRLVRTEEKPAPMREFAPDSGMLIQQCAGNIATSRQEAMIALLGRMGRTDAAPQCADIATGDGDPSLRWQAVRECLAMDTAIGFAALSQLARDADDPLTRDAGALRAQLLETYPQLHQLETTPCLA